MNITVCNNDYEHVLNKRVYVDHFHCSMEGSVAKLHEIVELKKKYKVSPPIIPVANISSIQPLDCNNQGLGHTNLMFCFTSMATLTFANSAYK